MAAQAVCNVPGCDKAGRLRRGWCNTHYLRWQRHGDPTAGRTPNGDRVAYMLAHMWDDCPRWPFPRSQDGYARVDYGGRRSRTVHRLVCEIAHGPPPTPQHEAAHSCGKGHEGCFGARCVSWKTSAQNSADSIQHGTWNRGERVPQHKLTEAQVREIDAMRPKVTTGQGATEVADRYGVNAQAIADIWIGRSWRWLTGRERQR
jgi:hypothetical protein